MSDQQQKAKQQQQQQAQKAREQKATNRQHSSASHTCPHCGAACEEGDAFCAECGKSINERLCPHCHAQISETCELCPVCGRPIDETICSFCGAPFEGKEAFCAECGSPRDGIKCPKCGKRSFRSFCSHCNEPLNANAQAAIKAAKADPKFQRVLKLNQEMAKLELYLFDLKEQVERAIADEELATSNGGGGMPPLSPEGEKLRAQHAELMKLLGNLPAPKPAQQQMPQSTARQELKVKFVDANAVMEEYMSKRDELQDAIKDMMPDANMTPSMQRDYACARKVPVLETEKVMRPTWWVCNFCGCYHNQPSECAEPWHGGKWLTAEVTIEKKVWKYIN